MLLIAYYSSRLQNLLIPHAMPLLWLLHLFTSFTFLHMKEYGSSCTTKTEHLQQWAELFYTFLFVILCWRCKDIEILIYFSAHLRIVLSTHLENLK